MRKKERDARAPSRRIAVADSAEQLSERPQSHRKSASSKAARGLSLRELDSLHVATPSSMLAVEMDAAFARSRRTPTLASMGLEEGVADEISAGRSFADIRSASMARAATMRANRASLARTATLSGAARSASATVVLGKGGGALAKLPTFIRAVAAGAAPLGKTYSMDSTGSAGSAAAGDYKAQLARVAEEGAFMTEAEAALHRVMVQETRQVPLFHSALILVLLVTTMLTSVLSPRVGCGTLASWLIKVRACLYAWFGGWRGWGPRRELWLNVASSCG